MKRFRLTKRERKGAVVFLIFIGSLIGIKFLLKEPSQSNFAPATLEYQVKSVHGSKKIKTFPKKDQAKFKSNEVEFKDSLFDLNTIQENELLSLGISEKEASFILKERSYHQGFIHLNQVDQVFGVKEVTKKYLKRNGKIHSLELNSASADQLLRFKGIGEKLSDRIIKYRNKLGGFYHLDQLYEVYGLDSNVVETMKTSLVLSEKVVQINVNRAGLDELNQHPYIGYQTAMQIIQERSVGELSDLSFLESQIGKEKLEKINFYAAF